MKVESKAHIHTGEGHGDIHREALRISRPDFDYDKRIFRKAKRCIQDCEVCGENREHSIDDHRRRCLYCGHTTWIKKKRYHRRNNKPMK